jgi:hypothetical protein
MAVVWKLLWDSPEDEQSAKSDAFLDPFVSKCVAVVRFSEELCHVRESSPLRKISM